MSDLIALMSSLLDTKGKILVPGLYDSVATVTEEESNLYDPIDFDMVRTPLAKLTVFMYDKLTDIYLVPICVTIIPAI